MSHGNEHGSDQQPGGQDSGEQAESWRGFSRRSLFRAGTGGVAAAAFVGLGSGNAAASPRRQGAATSPRPRVPRGPLAARQPHAATGRPPGGPVRGRPVPDIRILPIDRATVLAGARFDLRVEVTGVDPRTTRIDITVHGPDGPEPVLDGEPERTSSATDSLEVTYRGLGYPGSGEYTVRATARSRGRTSRASVTHQVVRVPAGKRPAKNIIFFLGDGMGSPAITAARILSRGITEGKYHGLLEMDRMEYRGFVGTSGADSIATDSANSMSAYMCGHKSSVNAMGVYESNADDPDGHPRVENVAELLKRTRGMSIGVVATSEIQDATPAAVFAHARRRSEYLDITDQALEPERMPDVWMGGGRAYLLPRDAEGSERDDDRDVIEEFRQAGFAHVSNRAELRRVTSAGPPDKLLGLFHDGDMDVYLDREHAKDPDRLGDWTDQPTLMEMTEAALEVVSRNDNGFFLMIEAASIDKMEHPLDGPRAVYDTIEFDKAIGLAKRWAEDRDDTLIVVTADHNHSMSIVGTHDRREADGRAGNGVYAAAGFPTYADSDGDGFPDDPDPDVSLFYGWSNHPDHTDGFRHQPVFREPSLLDEDTGNAVDNPERDPDAELQTGNLPLTQTNCVHTVEDVPIFASGPGAARFNAFLDNTEVFLAMMHALGLDPLTENTGP
ncbi:alkaline phosphatase [Haloechinothrix sp. LS1_15]|uniref:alkaline phosphatase n=1 Tax=Haloechinothrix sp. LS1_15 TaxID=2652248 RepID=UPI002945DB1B|nr:alkaline phosphatase [Haloechinothrix sp. LS1_15]MDV6011456.1 alkaline phosphatase [Haloechinothrix sp. LS1_15]